MVSASSSGALGRAVNTGDATAMSVGMAGIIGAFASGVAEIGGALSDVEHPVSSTPVETAATNNRSAVDLLLICMLDAFVERC